MERVKGPLIIILSVSAATGATIAFASTAPAPSSRRSSEPPLERTLDYSETVPTLAASKFVAAPDNDQAQTAATQGPSVGQSLIAVRTAPNSSDYRTEVTETETPDTAQKLAGFVRIRAPTTRTPATTA